VSAIRRLLGEADEFAPVLGSYPRKGGFRREAAKPQPKDKPKATRESLMAGLTELAASLEGCAELAAYGPAIHKLVEAISTNSFIPFDAEVTVTTTAQTDVVVQPKPPEKDAVLAAILG
jgi:hypothetical protein